MCGVAFWSRQSILLCCFQWRCYPSQEYIVDKISTCWAVPPWICTEPCGGHSDRPWLALTAVFLELKAVPTFSDKPEDKLGELFTVAYTLLYMCCLHSCWYLMILLIKKKNKKIKDTCGAGVWGCYSVITSSHLYVDLCSMSAYGNRP